MGAGLTAGDYNVALAEWPWNACFCMIFGVFTSNFRVNLASSLPIFMENCTISWYFAAMFSRDFNPPQAQSYFLFGPRGTGKSAFVENFYRDALFFDLLDSAVFNELLANPRALSARIPEGFGDWVVIDEVQKVPALLDEVHRLIEKRGLKFVLTGSSARRLRRGDVNLLAGRALTRHLHPLTAMELRDDFNWARSLKYGHLPAACTADNPGDFLKSYVHTYLREEIQQEGLTRNLPAFGRFMEAASFSQGAPLNISAIARDCAVSRKVVENYFSILRDTQLSHEIPVFARRAKRDLVARVKFYFFDAGVFRAIRPAGPYDSDSETGGVALETLVLQELAARNDYGDFNYKIHYWRTRQGAEVDFVLYGARGVMAVEVKNTPRVRREDLKGLRLFKEEHPQARLIFVYTGPRQFHEDGVDVIPAAVFFRALDFYLTG